jgi:two-component system, sensor histidine kinase and response regulator
MTASTDPSLQSSILVVDDTPANLRLLHQMLEREGYDVRVAPSGEMALRAVWDEPPDLILLDVIMPRMDGFTVCQELKADPRSRHIPVIFISALSDTEDKVRAFDEGGVDYITKPFQSAEVLARVNTHLDLIQSQRALRDLNERLEQSNRELEQFAYVAAHDIKAPLNRILGFSELLVLKSGPALDGDSRKYLVHIQQGVEHLSTLIDNLLSYSRISTQSKPFEPVDLRALAQGIRADLAGRIDELGANVEIGDLPRVLADESQMWQLLSNLVGNALKFHEPGTPPVVELYSEREDGFAVVSVRDNGIGIEAEYLDRIFEIFQRLHTSAEYEGTGIGLAVCKKIVQRHGGTIRIRSEPGEGTTFSFALPLQDPADGAGRPSGE